MKCRARSAEFYRIAKKPDKTMVCNKRSSDGSAKANLIDKADKADIEVRGVLFRMDCADLKKLDKCEVGYERKRMEVVDSNNKTIKAYVYLSSQLTDDRRPYDWYKELMLEGAREHKLPSKYVTFLEDLESKPDPDPKRRSRRC